VDKDEGVRNRSGARLADRHIARRDRARERDRLPVICPGSDLTSSCACVRMCIWVCDMCTTSG
jgi:hypothetical protein